MVKKITALKVQKRNRNRINVYLDGEYAFGLARIVAAWLRVGQELLDDKIAELRSQDGIETALLRALNFLSYRPRTEQEVRTNLKKHDYQEEIIDEIIDRLKRGGQVNDRQFAELWVENRSEFRPRGSHALRMELRQKGVAEPEITQALEELDEESLALKAARKHARRYKNLEYQEFRKKMSGYLTRRGFYYGVISAVVPQVWEELSSPENS